MKACLTSQFLRTHLLEIASPVSSQSSNCDITGAAVKSLDQVCGSWLPSTTIRYFSRFGRLKASYLIVAIAIEGSAWTPLLSILNSDSVRTSHVGREDRPSHSSRYALSQIALSDDDMDECQ